MRDERQAPDVYEIQTVLDFLKVPEARRGECLRDFAKFLQVVEPACQLMTHVSDATAGKGEIAFRPANLFRWIDDDREAVGMNVLMPDGSSHQVFDLTPDDAEKIAANLDALNVE